MTAKTPQDHKLPKTSPKTAIIHGVHLTVDPDLFDDLDMLEWLYDIQNANNGGDALAVVPFLRKICGPAWPQIKTALRDPDTGRIPMTAVTDFIGDLMNQIAPNS
ncbi:hypothetical protein JS533_013195 [Bifidobacterium amazonense]|uniref:Uncharacterized protein n=1 Tax=Bifidobacterium amazonense TaxID=2809027 RepID=A0ABS9W032_9BIFI|nr:hypothetical protein [Bifidobacterium amazonense]MCH9277205.1 hypothetical protein [Bifidobacterium amazonense]